MTMKKEEEPEEERGERGRRSKGDQKGKMRNARMVRRRR